jgi:hypothetical protein
MTDPARLADLETGQALELLRAAREVPGAPPGAVEQTLLSLGVGAPAAAVSATATMSSLAVAKWVLLGVAIGTGASATVVSLRQPPNAAVPQRAVTRAAPSIPSSATVWGPTESATPLPTFPSASSSLSAPSPASSPTAAREPATLAGEIARLDGARAALARGNAVGALSLLDEYDARYPSGQLAPEAALLRARALMAAGNVEAARRLARLLLQQATDEAYAERVRETIGEEP